MTTKATRSEPPAAGPAASLRAYRREWYARLKADPVRYEKRRTRMRAWRARAKADPEWRAKELVRRKQAWRNLRSYPEEYERYLARARERYRLQISTPEGARRMSEATRQRRIKARAKSSLSAERRALRRLLSRYGLAVEEYVELAVRQNWACAICGSTGRLLVDHDHETGSIRGLLCNRCNAGLGFFAEKAHLLLKAAAYVLHGHTKCVGV